MKRILLMLALSGFFGAPMLAQEGEAPEGEKSTEELLKELHKLMKEASREMGEAEKELAKASLPANKADVLAERLRVLREKMAKGEIDEIPEGLKDYLRENVDEIAKDTGKSAEELKKIIDNQEALKELLKKSPDLLKKLAQSEDTMEKVLRAEQNAEKKLEETLKKQREASEKAGEKVDKAIDLANQVRQQGQGQGQPKNKDEKSTKDPKDKGDQPKDPKDGSKNAEKEYQPGDGKMERDDKTEDFTRREGDGFKAESRKKDLGEGSGSDATGEPTKYKGFWEKWRNEMEKRNKDAKKEGDKPK